MGLMWLGHDIVLKAVKLCLQPYLTLPFPVTGRSEQRGREGTEWRPEEETYQEVPTGCTSDKAMWPEKPEEFIHTSQWQGDG